MILYKYKDLKIVAYERSPDKRDQYMHKGFAIHKIEALLKDELIGYIKISYVPQRNIRNFMPTIEHYVRQCQGWVYSMTDRDNMWRRIRSHHRWNADISEVPEPEERDRQIKEMLSRFENDYAMFQYNFEFPFIDYSRTFNKYRRKDLATLLYCVAAKFMVRLSPKPLRASGLQSLEAQGLWKYLKEKKIATKTVYIYGEDRMAIDSRQIGKKQINKMMKKVYERLV